MGHKMSGVIGRELWNSTRRWSSSEYAAIAASLTAVPEFLWKDGTGNSSELVGR